MVETIPDDVLHEAKLILARQKFWTKDSEKLLRRWKKQIRNRYKGHKEKEATFWYWLYGSAILVILLAAISSVIAFGDNGCDTSTTFNININGTVIGAIAPASSDINTTRFVVGTLSAVAAAISAISTLMDYGGERKAHKDASSDCDALAREIDDLLQRPTVQRGDAVAEMQKIRNKFDLIVQNSPSVAEKYRTSLEANVISKTSHVSTTSNFTGKVVAPPSSSIIFDETNIRKKKSTPNTDVLANIMIKNIEEMEKENEEHEKKIKEANDYNTDEEDKEVTLGFDLDEFRPDDTLETTKHRIIKESFERAMQFELQRLGENKHTSPIPDRKSETLDKHQTNKNIEKDKDEKYDDDKPHDDKPHDDQKMKSSETDLYDYL